MEWEKLLTKREDYIDMFRKQYPKETEILDLLEEMIGPETAVKSHPYGDESTPISKYSYFAHLLKDGRTMGLITINEEHRVSHALAKEWLA